MERKSLALCFFLLFLFASQEMVARTEAAPRLCKALSDKFKGPCLDSGVCEDVCKKKEHLADGSCKNFKCYCTRFC